MWLIKIKMKDVPRSGGITLDILIHLWLQQLNPYFLEKTGYYNLNTWLWNMKQKNTSGKAVPKMFIASVSLGWNKYKNNKTHSLYCHLVPAIFLLY